MRKLVEAVLVEGKELAAGKADFELGWRMRGLFWC
jgi:hypothetical protein